MPEADEAALAAYADGTPRRRPSGPRSRPGSAASRRWPPRSSSQRAGLAAITTAAESVSAPLALRSRIEAHAARRARRRAAAAARRGWGWLPSAGARGRRARGRRDRDRLQRRPGHRRGARRRGPRRPSPPSSSTRPSRAAARPGRRRALPQLRGQVRLGGRWAPGPTRSAAARPRPSSTARRAAGSPTRSSRATSSPGRPARTRPSARASSCARSQDGDRTVVTWRRNGRTCVLSATNVPTDQLLELAAWKGQGAVDVLGRARRSAAGRRACGPHAARHARPRCSRAS